MSYTCPHCHGGFDEPATPGEVRALPECPWCGTRLNGKYDPERFERVVSAVRSDDTERNKPEPMLDKLKRFFG